MWTAVGGARGGRKGRGRMTCAGARGVPAVECGEAYRGDA